MPLIATLALLGAACSQAPETVVVGPGAGSETSVDVVEGEEPDGPPPTEVVDEEPVAGEEPVTTLPPEVDEPREPSISDDPLIADEPPVMPGGDPTESWRSEPLAHAVLTAADLGVLGLDVDWEAERITWSEVDDELSSGDTVCGQPVPAEASHFTSSFSSTNADSALELMVIPEYGEARASSLLGALQLLATCPDLEEEYETLSVELVDVSIEGAEQSVVLRGVDRSDGITIAGALVDGHMFFAFVAQDSGNPVASDVDAVVAAVELSISRL